MEVKVLDEKPGKKTTQTTRDKIGENVYYSVYTSQIKDKLEKDGVYKVKEGDIVSVNVKNTNMDGEYRQVKGLNIRDSKNNGLTIINLKDKITTGFHRLYNNIYTNELGYVINDETMFVKIKRCTFLSKLNHGTGYTPINTKNVICENCLFESSQTIGSSTIINSTIKNSSNVRSYAYIKKYNR